MIILGFYVPLKQYCKTIIVYFLIDFLYIWLSKFTCSIGLLYSAARFLAHSGISWSDFLDGANLLWARLCEVTGTWRLSTVDVKDCLPLCGSESGLFNTSLISSHSWTEIWIGACSYYNKHNNYNKRIKH